MSKLTFASVISEIQQSDIYMTVKARICEAPQANLNGARVTEAFIDEIVGNEERYVGLPLYADKKALIGGNYTRLGHLYDEKTGEFHSTQIGSFYKFEKQTLNEGCALVGYARIPKRNRKLSKAISELFADGKLKFSFEVAVGEYEELDDSTILIDASENNYLEGTAIVTYPACEEAVALELVAQHQADDARKGDEEMAEVENKAEVVETEAAQPELAEEKKAEEETKEEVTAEQPEDETACKKKENSEEDPEKAEEKAEEEKEEETACKDKKKAETETATVYVTEVEESTVTTSAFDTETGKSVSQTVNVRTVSDTPVEGTLVQTTDGIHVAETEVAEETPGEEAADAPAETPATETPAQTDTTTETPQTRGAETNTVDETVPVIEDEERKTAEQMIAELLEIVNGLKKEIAELKEPKQEVQTVIGEINPFVDTIKVAPKYDLLQKEEKVSAYTLLS